MAHEEALERLPDGVLHTIATATFERTGAEFFDQLVKQLALALDTRYAWITEWFEGPQRLRALSFWGVDASMRNFEYTIAGTPCAPVVEDRRLVHVPDRIVELYPDDLALEPLDAVSYLGVPLEDQDGLLLGHLAVMHDAPMAAHPDVVAVLKIFAGRAAAELRRLRRDRALEQRERQLRSLVDSALDGIVEMDSAYCVVRMNPAARRALACGEGECAGDPISRYLTPKACETLHVLLDSLCAGEVGRESLWITEAIEAVKQGGDTFRAEVAIACYAVDGERFHTLFLRNVNDRIEAEDRIAALLEQTASLRAEIGSLQGFGEIVGRSSAIRAVLRDVDAVAATDATVLITGETGTGKERVAAAIHQRSNRNAAPLIKVNCAAIPANLQESEFFGHERGAFTGATQRRDGLFKRAHRGTIFLDEVGELPLDLQAKLLRVLQEGEFQPVGSASVISVDVRVVAATNRDLERSVKEGNFRMDLLYRLNVFPIAMPPLRVRGEDILLLARVFANNAAMRRGWREARITTEDEARLKAYDWPGNVRELENVIERAIITATDGRTLNLARALPEIHLPAREVEALSMGDESRILTAADLRALERDNIIRALAQAEGKIAGAGGAAERLGMNPNTLSSRMKSLDIRR